MPNQPLQLEVTSGDSFVVQHFTVEERMDGLFTVNLVAGSQSANIDFESIVGQTAAFTIHYGSRDGASGLTTGQRRWSGICEHLRQLRGVDAMSTYQLCIVPALWHASQRRNYRIFQQLSELDIALQLFGEWGIEPEQQVDATTYKKRDYRVQYGESDYAFICRMLQEAGISFYFKATEAETKVVLDDAPHSRDKREPAITYHDEANRVTGEYVTRARLVRQMRPGQYTTRDVDFRLPADYPLSAEANAGSTDRERRMEQYHFSPGAFLYEARPDGSTPVADDRGAVRSDQAEGATLVQKRLDATRNDAKRYVFETNVHDLAPGMLLSVSNHPHSLFDQNQKLLVVESSFTGSDDGTLMHYCGVRSTDVPYRPALLTPKPRTTGVESATVVGPENEEIHTDEFGRVRVQFHWDREGKKNQESSCWVPVSQPWAGAGYGTMFLPRVHQEVIVDFFKGDPDQPVIIGRLYTNTQKVPYTLPKSKTQTGWKTNSSPGGGGYNEIMMDDAAGKELVRVQAQKDLSAFIKNDADVTVGNDLSQLTRNNETKEIGVNKTTTVGANRSVRIGSTNSVNAGSKHAVSISPPSGGGSATTFTMEHNKINHSTPDGHATTTLDDTKQIIFAKEKINLSVGGSTIVLTPSKIELKNGGSTIEITDKEIRINGGPFVKINC